MHFRDVVHTFSATFVTSSTHHVRNRACKPGVPNSNSVKIQGFSLDEKLWIVNHSEKEFLPKTIAREIEHAPSTV